MIHPEITRTAGAIHNPADPRHFMRLKPVTHQISVQLGGTLLAQTRNALRLVEVSHDVYDPTFYIHAGDIRANLLHVPGRTSHCPLKGNAEYYCVDGWMPASGEDYLAWSYTKPLEFAIQLESRFAFNPAHVTIIEMP